MEKIVGIDMISLQETVEERSLDFHPTSFEDYLGQAALKEKLRIYTQAAKIRQEPLDHLLLFGPPGVGKTTLAHIMAHVMNVSIKLCSGPMMERTGDLVSILSGLEPRDILFIDEIHRMPTHVEEVLYSAMEHFRIDVILGQGAGAKSVSLPIHPFTLVGATTKSGKISAPLRSRFGITERLDYYSDTELASIVKQAAQHLNLSLSDISALRIGSCARGTPRIAKKILRRVRDFAQVHNLAQAQDLASSSSPDTRSATEIKTSFNHDFVIHASDEQVAQALIFLGIDEEGLTNLDLLLLKKIMLNFHGGPVGLETLAYLIGEDAETIETVYEPFLLRSGYLEKTARGRQIPATQRARLLKKLLGQDTIA